MSQNPYESAQPAHSDALESSRGYEGLKRTKRRRTLLLVISLAWVAFAIITSTYADNLRYMSSLSRFIAYASFVGVGNVACLVCLSLSVRGWWHLLVAPIWFLCIVELLILGVYSAAAIGLIHLKPWSERSSQQGAIPFDPAIVRYCAAPPGLQSSFES